MLELFINIIKFENLLILIFSNSLLISSGFVILSRNSVYSAFFLVLSFISSTGLLLLLECEFIALMFIIIYVGAIAVLFIYVVFMLDLKNTASQSSNNNTLSMIFYVSFIFFFVIILSYFTTFILNGYSNFSYSTGLNFYNNNYFNWFFNLDFLTELHVFGQLIYTFYIFQFLLVGFILLLAVIGAVLLTINYSSKNLLKQAAFKQISRSFKNILL